MQTFWRKGYRETSVDDLVAATSVSRYGLYQAFGGKRGLFIAVLDRYRDGQVSLMLADLERKGATIEDVRKFFIGIVAMAGGAVARRGCLFCNTAVEVGTADRDVSARILRHFARMEAAMCRALENGARRKHLPAAVAPAPAAAFLTGIAQGLFVLLRAGQPKSKIDAYVTVALHALQGAR